MPSRHSSLHRRASSMADVGVVFAVVISIVLGILGILMVWTILRRRKHARHEQDIQKPQPQVPLHITPVVTPISGRSTPMVPSFVPAKLSPAKTNMTRHPQSPVRPPESLQVHLPVSPQPPRPISKDRISQRLQQASRRVSRKPSNHYFAMSSSSLIDADKHVFISHEVALDSMHSLAKSRCFDGSSESIYSGISCPPHLHARMLRGWPSMSFPMPPSIPSPRIQDERATPHQFREIPVQDIEVDPVHAEMFGEDVERQPLSSRNAQDDAVERMISKMTAEPITSLLEALSRPWSMAAPAASSQSLIRESSPPTLPSVAVSPLTIGIANPRISACTTTPPFTPLDDAKQQSLSFNTTPHTSEISDSSCNMSSGPTTPTTLHREPVRYHSKRFVDGGVSRLSQAGEDPFMWRWKPQDLFRFTGSRLSASISQPSSMYATK